MNEIKYKGFIPKIRRNSKAWKAIADACETPGDFIGAVMRIRGYTCSSLARELNVSSVYINMTLNNSPAPATKACLKIATVLNVDPFLLARMSSDFQMKQLIKENGL